MYFLAVPTHAVLNVVVHIPAFGYKNWVLVFACAILALSGLKSARGAEGGSVSRRENWREA